MEQPIDKALFAQRLTELLSTSSENTYTLAEKLALSPATISRYANALMSPKKVTIHALAEVFGVNPDWLMGNNAPKFLSSPAPAIDPETLEFARQFTKLSNDEQKLIYSAMQGMLNDKK